MHCSEGALWHYYPYNTLLKHRMWRRKKNSFLFWSLLKECDDSSGLQWMASSPSVHFRGILRRIPCFLWTPGHDLFHTILFWFKCIGMKNNNFHCSKPTTLMYSFAPWVLRWKQHTDFPSIPYPNGDYHFCSDRLHGTKCVPCLTPATAAANHSVKQMSHGETSGLPAAQNGAHTSRPALTQASPACMRNSVPKRQCLNNRR